MERIIFYIPFKIDKKRFSASQIRPMKMLQAFENIGYEIDVVEGCASERCRKIDKIKENIKSGIKYAFLYSESSTMPTLLTERSHYPIYPLLDFSFLQYCKMHGVKIGLFYRDIYWCFKSYDISLKRKIAKWFYKYDLRQYQKLVDVLFIPSLEMLSYLPYKMKMHIQDLPSGCVIHEENCRQIQRNRKIELLYIGAVGPHYGLDLLLKSLNEIATIHFTLCCRKEDWNKVSEQYTQYLSEDITIVHESGDELKRLYVNADMFCLFMEPSEYRKFAVPYKLFEAIGWKCPILATRGTWVADFVAKNEIGAICNYDESSLKNCIESLYSHIDLINYYKENIKKIASQHTWTARCKKVAEILTKI